MKKRLIFITLFILILSGCSNQPNENVTNNSATSSKEKPIIEVPEEYMAEKHPMSEGFAGGDGTEENPYQIANAEQLTYWADTMNNSEDWMEKDHLSEAYYILTDDIVFNDLSDFDNWDKQAPAYRWEAIGSKQYAFRGGLDGNGHTISGLYIIESGNDYNDASYTYRAAFIGKLYDGYIRNLTVDKSYYRCLEGTYGSAGIVMDLNNSSIENCIASVTIDYAGCTSYVAGVVQRGFMSSIINCVFDGKITSIDTWSVSGIVGEVCGGEIKGCINRGLMETVETGSYGIAGEVSDCSLVEQTIVKDCINYSDITGCGLFGSIRAGYSQVLVEDCINYGNVTGRAGIVGTLRSYQASIGNPDKLSGKVILRNCTNKGDIVSAGDGAAGCIGTVIFSSDMEISSCVNEGTVSGKESIGGIIGDVNASQLDECVNSKFIIIGCTNYEEVAGSELGVGGIIGILDFYSEDEAINHEIYVSNNRNCGNIIGGGYGVGGILGGVLGMHGGAGDSVNIDANTNEGCVQGIMPFVCVGGIVGYYPAKNQTQSVTNCTNTGVVALVEREDDITEINASMHYGIAGGIAGAVQENVIMENNNFAGTITVSDRYKNHVMIYEEEAFVMPAGNAMLFMK